MEINQLNETADIFIRGGNMPERMKQNEEKRESVRIKQMSLDSHSVIAGSKRVKLFSFILSLS